MVPAVAILSPQMDAKPAQPKMVPIAKPPGNCPKIFRPASYKLTLIPDLKHRNPIITKKGITQKK
jgi:hypothetical protein